MPKGFTLLEILVTVAVLTIILSMSIIGLRDFQERKALQASERITRSLIEDARIRTLGSKYDAQYGVRFATSSVTLFRGSAYMDSDPNNEVSQLPSFAEITDVALSDGSSEIVFERLTGSASASGTIQFSLVSDATASGTLSISLGGLVE